MNIAIDIDDTIMDTLDHLMPYLAEYFNAFAKSASLDGNIRFNQL